MSDKLISETVSRFCRTMQAYRKFCLSSLLFALAFFVLASTVSAQPAMSRGEQLLPISYDECMRRAEQSFAREGWVNIGKGGAFVQAFKENHGAYIMCNGAPENKIWVNVVVASSSPDKNVPGAERVKLQERMGQSQSESSGFTGNWTYQDGSFSDTFIFSANGTVITPNNSSVTARWSVEGNELVLRWSNGWTNRYQLPVNSGRLSGTAYGPNGERNAITLSRQ